MKVSLIIKSLMFVISLSLVLATNLQAQPMETKMPAPLQINSEEIGSLDKINQGAQLLAEGKTMRAEVILGEALIEHPESPEAAYNFGLALAFNGKLYEAIQANFKTLELKENFPEAHLALGNIFMTIGDFQQALDAFEQAIELSSNEQLTGTATFNRAVALGKLGRYAEAQLEFSSCLAATPNDQAIPFQLAALSLRRGKPASAIKWLDSMNDEYAIESNLMKARAYLSLKDSKKAYLALATAKKSLAKDSELKANTDLNRIINEIESEIKNSKKKSGN
ncbi:MAG: tetratricopeptide repeat protein [Candidatus Rifleibacteriota bacterium]